jgi:hypothetical protein
MYLAGNGYGRTSLAILRTETVSHLELTETLLLDAGAEALAAEAAE